MYIQERNTDEARELGSCVFSSCLNPLGVFSAAAGAGGGGTACCNVESTEKQKLEPKTLPVKANYLF